jgi:hemolysin-activating ACP:hemolysin acyltransferase
MINDTENDLETTLSILSTSPIHKKYTIEDINRLVIPPLKLNQYRIYKLEPDSLCYLSWAYLSPEVTEKYICGDYKLTSEDWNSGNMLWLINVVCNGTAKTIDAFRMLDRERSIALKMGLLNKKDLTNIYYRRMNKEKNDNKLFRVLKRTQYA